MQNIYNSEHLKRTHYSVPLTEQNEKINDLQKRTDIESKRLQLYLSLPDLTKTEGSPLKIVIEKVLGLNEFKNFDVIDTPEVISPVTVFDLFNFPQDHPARKATDTYFVDNDHILRPHTSLMWKYYFDLPEVRKQLDQYGSAGALSYGKIYRRDEIDWQHSNVCHQCDGLFVCKKEKKVITQADLEDICRKVTHCLLGEDVKEKFLIDKFPYTDPSIEMDIAWEDKWVEVNGAGIVHPQVLRNLGIDPEVYNGWAFGFGIDRLTMLKMKIPDIRLLRSTDKRVADQLIDIDHIYIPVSKYPPVVRDISFIVDKGTFNLNAYYDNVRDTAGDDYVEQVKILDQYENAEKFGQNKISYTFRIIYRHINRTLTGEEVNKLHEDLHRVTEVKYGAEIRK